MACGILVLIAGLELPLAAQAPPSPPPQPASAPAMSSDALHAVQVLRQGGCGGILPAAQPLHHDPLLDRSAKQWALGRALAAALAQSGYDARATEALHVRGPDAAAIQLIRRSGCATVMDRSMHEIGFYQLGLDTWLVLTAERVRPSAPRQAAVASAVPTKPDSSQPSVQPDYALQLVNDARARGVRCGNRSFGPAPPLRLSGTLSEVAFGHAIDMANHNYFEHDDLLGQPPAGRV